MDPQTEEMKRIVAGMQVLLSQPKPNSEKSPYFELERKHRIKLHFAPFIELQPIGAKEFRKQKIDFKDYTSVIFTSRNAIDHFFRILEETRNSIGQDTKYFCITEAVALYLQKFILYRKRKVFYGADGTNKSLFDVINKHKDHERFLYPCSENQQDSEIENWLKNHNVEYATPFLYKSVSADIRDLLLERTYDVICFFTPSSVKSLFDNVPGFEQGETYVGGFGNNTHTAIHEAGFRLDIKAPLPNSPSMITALDKFFSEIEHKS